MAWLNTHVKLPAEIERNTRDRRRGPPISINTLNVFAISADEDGDAILMSITGAKLSLDVPMIEFVTMAADAEAMENDD